MRTPLKSIVRAAIRPLPVLLILFIGAIGVQTFTGCEEKKSEAEIAALLAAQAAAEAEGAAFVKAAEEAKEAAKAAAIAAAKAEAEKAAKAVSCKGDGGLKLLGCITSDNGDVIKKFQYDKQNRLVKIYDYSGKELSDFTTITYSGDEQITVDGRKYTKKGDTVTIKSDENPKPLTIDKDGYIVKVEDEGWWTTDYQYQDGNLTNTQGFRTDGMGSGSEGYTYDDKKSPFSNTATPKWLLQRVISSSYAYASYPDASKNNVIAYSCNIEEAGGHHSVSITYKYEYDSDGFPTKRTAEEEIELGAEGEEETSIGRDTTIARFTYRGKEKNVPVEADK